MWSFLPVQLLMKVHIIDNKTHFIFDENARKMNKINLYGSGKCCEHVINMS